MTFSLSDMTFTQVLIFITVAKEKSFSKAAARLHMTQPAVTKEHCPHGASALRSLFIRTTRQIELTREGDYLYRQWRPVFFSMEQALTYRPSLAGGTADAPSCRSDQHY